MKIKYATIVLTFFSHVSDVTCQPAAMFDAESCMRAQRPEERIIYCSRALESEKALPLEMALNVRMMRGNSYGLLAVAKDQQGAWDMRQQQELWEKGAADFSAVIAVNPYRADAYEERGLIYLGSARYKEAIADYTKAIELSHEPKAFFERGLVYQKLGLSKEAIADYREALARGQKDQRLVERVRELLKELGVSE